VVGLARQRGVVSDLEGVGCGLKRRSDTRWRLSRAPRG